MCTIRRGLTSRSGRSGSAERLEAPDPVPPGCLPGSHLCVLAVFFSFFRPSPKGEKKRKLITSRRTLTSPSGFAESSLNADILMPTRPAVLARMQVQGRPCRSITAGGGRTPKRRGRSGAISTYATCVSARARVRKETAYSSIA